MWLIACTVVYFCNIPVPPQLWGVAIAFFGVSVAVKVIQKVKK